MKILRISLLTSLMLALGAQAWAQDPTASPAPEARQSQAPASLSKRERIELCRKKRGVPLAPEEPQPQQIGESRGITRPTPIYQVSPHVYFRGTIAVETLIDEDGCVRQTRVVHSVGQRFDDAAAKAFEQWVFLPATQDGRPVRVYYVLTVSVQ